MSIYTGQPIPLSTTFTDASGVVDISGGTITYNYWKPSDRLSVGPTDTLDGTIVSGAAGTATGEITLDLVDESGTWIVQAVATLSSRPWPECSTEFTVLARGKTC